MTPRKDVREGLFTKGDWQVPKSRSSDELSVRKEREGSPWPGRRRHSHRQAEGSVPVVPGRLWKVVRCVACSEAGSLEDPDLLPAGELGAVKRSAGTGRGGVAGGIGRSLGDLLMTLMTGGKAGEPGPRDGPG